MSSLVCVVALTLLYPLNAAARPLSGGESATTKAVFRQQLVEARSSGSASNHRDILEQLPAVYRGEAANAAGSGAISPPNVRANDPTRGQNRDTQSQVSIAAWGDNVVAIWLDATLDDQGQLPASITAYAYSCDRGATFTDGGVIPAPLYDDYVNFGELTVDGQGNFYAALNMQHGGASGNPYGYTYDVHAVWKGRFTGCSFAWSGPSEVTNEAADSLRFLYYPHIVADPEDGSLYIAYSRHVAHFTQQMEVASSLDGGLTWSQPTIIESPQANFDPDDPRLAVGPNHEVYIAWSGDPKFALLFCDNSSLAPTDVIRFTRSLDHGATWRSASTIAPEYPDHWMTTPGDYRGRDNEVLSIAVDRSQGPQRGTVYVGWAESGQWEALPQFPDTVSEIEPNALPLAATPFTLDRAGRGTSADIDDVDYWKLDLQAGDDVLIFLEADDWTCTGLATSNHTFYMRMYPEPEHLDQQPDTLLAGSSLHFAPERIVFSCKRSGTYYLKVKLVEQDQDTNVGYTISARRVRFLDPTPATAARDERDIVLVRSTDQGTSWSAKTLVNWDAPQGYSESLPFLTVDDSGALAAFWYDRRQSEAPNSPVSHGLLTDVYMAQSLDGLSFSPARRVTEESSVFLGFPTFDWNIGDFQSAFAVGRDIYAGWTDGRGSNTSTSGIDVYIDHVVRPRAQTDGTSVQFPHATEGDSVETTIDLANYGSTPLQVTSISVPFSAMTVTPSPPFQVPVDGTVPLRFDVRPITTGDSTGAVRIASSDPFDSLRTLPVVARARPLGFQILSEEFFRDPIVLQGQDIPVVVVMDDSVQVDSLWVYYRAGGAQTFAQLALNPISSGESPRYRAFIPNDAVGPSGLEFYVAARNGIATSYRPLPSQPIRFQVRVADLLLPAQTANAYRMISVPLDCGGAPLMDLLRDNLGPTDPTSWRVYEIGSSTPELTQYRELTADDQAPLQLGSAYWLITRNAPSLDTSPVVGLSTPTAMDYAFTLDRTWNMIGSPFDFPVAWSDVRVDGTPTGGQSIVEAPMLWNPSTQKYDPSDVLTPFEGYFVKRNGDAAVTLTMAPTASASALAASTNDVRATSSGAWGLTVRLSGGDDQQDVASVGVSTLGRSDHDRLDGSHPPPTPGDGVWLAIPHPDWKDYRGPYQRDIREPLTEASASSPIGHSWPLSVAVHSAERQWKELTLGVEGIENIPSGLRAVLVDDRLGRTVDLRADHRYRFAEEPSGAGSEPRFRLLVGNAAFIEQGGTPPTTLTSGLSDLAPTPFQTNMLIRYVVASPGTVDLAVFDVQGRRLMTLAKGSQEPGSYEVVWAGASERGGSLNPGLYFIRLDIAGRTQIRKVLKIGSSRGRG